MKKSSLQPNLTCNDPVCNTSLWGSPAWPDDNDILLDLLFDLATWHAFAKLWLHTEQTLELFDAATNYLGHSTRKSEHATCSYYHTTELPQEHAAHGHRIATLSAKQGCAIPMVTSRSKQKKHIQVPCSGWLCGHNTNVWNYRQLHDTDSKYLECFILSISTSLLSGQTWTLPCKMALSTIWKEEGTCGQEHHQSRCDWLIHPQGWQHMKKLDSSKAARVTAMTHPYLSIRPLFNCSDITQDR